MKLQSAPNLNILWSYLLIDELIRHGVEYFCICPGSRNSPLTVAVAMHKKAKTFIHFDERGNAFHALGFTTATKKPACVITTSGTAVANLFPAIIESSKKKLPMIVLTADRPAELRNTGAHQTIDQVKIFGDYVRFSMDMPAPCEKIMPEFVLTSVDQIIQKSKGDLPGPVHLNCMFREPLAPTKQKLPSKDYFKNITKWSKLNTPYTKYINQTKSISSSELNEVAKSLQSIKNGIIAVGKLNSEEEKLSVLKLAQKLQWPIFADLTSGLRVGKTYPEVIHYFDHILLSNKWQLKIAPDGILHLGGRITSKRYYQFIASSKPKTYISVINHPLRNDPLHCVTIRVISSVIDFANSILAKVKKRRNNKKLDRLIHANNALDTNISNFIKSQKTLTELAAARIISQTISKNNGLFLSNSLPIREYEMVADFNGTNCKIGSNRGASGIDGIIASASGFCEGISKHSTCVIGDLSFLYDMNSLAMINQLSKHMTIVVMNNNGGGIFQMLPIAKHNQIFEKYFGTPHDLTFKHTASMFGLTFAQPKTNREFKEAYEKSLTAKKSTLIEVLTTRKATVDSIHKLQEKNKRSLNLIKV